jgi:predicted RNA-binding protein
MVDAVRVSVDSARCVCTDVIGRSAALDGVRVSEIDLMRHRVILERA